MAWLEVKDATRADAVAFWQSIGSPQPQDLPMDDWGPWACIGCGQHDADYVQMYVGKDDTWQWVRIPVPDDGDEWAGIVVEPGMFVIWQHDHDCAGWCGPDPDPFDGLWRLVPDPVATPDDEQRWPQRPVCRYR